MFVLPAGYGALRKQLTTSSKKAARRARWLRAKPKILTVARTGFGAGLLVSIAVIFAAITVINSAERSNDGDRSGGGGGGYYRSPFFSPYGFFGPSPFDLLYYRPYGWVCAAPPRAHGWFGGVGGWAVTSAPAAAGGRVSARRG